jgi:hypothetical protein
MASNAAAAATVEVDGVECSRRAIVQAIRSVRHTDPVTGETLKGMRAVAAVCGVHSSTISRRLAAGGVLSSDAIGRDVEAALLHMLPGDSRRYAAHPVSGSVANVNPQAHPASSAAQQPAAAQPVQAQPVQAQPAAAQPQQRPSAPQPPKAQPDPIGDPLAATPLAALVRRIHKPLADARKAIEAGALDSVCGIRKAALVCRILGVLEREGWTRRDALGAAYYSAVVAKEPADMRLHVVEPFVSEFGYVPALPSLSRVIEDPTRPGEWLHPVVPFLAVLLREGIHVWTYGEAGAGKSRAIRDAARLLGRTNVVFPCHKHTHTDDALGGKELVNGATVDRLGPWPTAMQTGAVLTLEEPSKAHPGVLAVAHSMLEERELTLPNVTGSPVVTAVPGFVVAAADNAEAGRDPGRYVAVNQMDPAFLDRFAMVEVSSLPVSAELDIMARAYAAPEGR